MTKLCIFVGMTLGGIVGGFVVSGLGIWAGFFVSGLGSVVGVYLGWKLARKLEG
ncbi:MAG TPA: hypothetical protein VGG34_04585 [Opitutaceae bacterium]